ncbi:MAG: hypothetical protein ACI90E_002143, partial [Yoonia sp.]
ASIRLEPAAPGELLGMMRDVPLPETVKARKLSKKARALVTRRSVVELLRPEYGALATLCVAVALALFMALMPAAESVTPSPPIVENAQ